MCSQSVQNIILQFFGSTVPKPLRYTSATTVTLTCTIPFEEYITCTACQRATEKERLNRQLFRSWLSFDRSLIIVQLRIFLSYWSRNEETFNFKVQYTNLRRTITQQGPHYLLFVCLFTAAREIFQLSGGCHHSRWQGCKFRPILSIYSFYQLGILNYVRTYCDTGPQFIRSHPKDRYPRLNYQR
jgi:hypothetical protein